ncbi:hypothetical protein HHK36_015930 [Tetracentron sinense]|uniref:ATP-dependent DNA helicase n=1 Tax=Tetracentron sinense TaxID=13715 RepID=A0A834Z400_TETSI|nr:hypothetical protein HHK36_015930 [Tetracentron sinense]
MLCCQSGKIQLPHLLSAPGYLQTLLQDREFKEHIRGYNSILSFTSMGGKVDHSVLDGRGPYTFRINGENYHRIGALLPSSGHNPKFAQLYVYDTEYEIRNRINAVVDTNNTSQYDVSIVSGLQRMLDNINPYVRVFRMARDILAKDETLNFHIRIIERRDERQYNKPTSSEVAALIIGDVTEDAEYHDIIVCTTEGERYYLQMLLHIIRGATNFEDLRTVDCIIYPTFKAACSALGLLDDDTEWHESLNEASLWATGRQLRDMFYTVVLKDMSLNEIELILNRNGRSLKEFAGMPMPSLETPTLLLNRLIREEMSFDVDLEKHNFEILHSGLNEKQHFVFEQVVESYINKKCGVFFVYGSGGTGKTYLWKTLIAYIRANKKIVLSVASSGIAALLLSGGRTAHSRFKIPLNLDETSCCSIAQRTDLAKPIQEADLLLWDEAPMTNRHAFEAVNRTFQDLIRPLDYNAANKAFGGKTVVLGGDFRQILPVVRKGTRESIVASSLQRSNIWAQCRVLELHTNIRVMSTTITEEQRLEARKFAQWILDVGDGRVPTTSVSGSGESNWIEISNEFLIDNTNDGLNHLFENIFPDLRSRYLDWLYLQERSILALKNIDIDEINSILLSMLPGDAQSFLSADTLGSTDDNSEQDMMDYETFDLIHPYKSSWTIKVRVGRVFDVYEYNNAKGCGKLLKLILIDEKKIGDNCSEISVRKYHFTEFKLLRGLLNSEETKTDIIGVIVAVNPSIEVHKKNGNNTFKRDIIVVDTTLTSIILTLWGPLTSKYDDQLLHAMNKHVILVAIALSVREYQGDMYLSSTISTILKFEPSIPEVKRILEWLHIEGDIILLNSSRNVTYGSGSKFSAIEDKVPINDLITASSTCPSQESESNDLDIKLMRCMMKEYWFQIRLTPENHLLITMQGFTVSNIKECNFTESDMKLHQKQRKRKNLDDEGISKCNVPLILSSDNNVIESAIKRA